VLSWVNQGRVSIENGQIILNVESTESVDRSGVYLRVVEQQQRGLISRSNQTYEITSMGKLALVIANMLAQTFSLENWETNKK
jgi:predicted transcriptional regulator